MLTLVNSIKKKGITLICSPAVALAVLAAVIFLFDAGVSKVWCRWATH